MTDDDLPQYDKNVHQRLADAMSVVTYIQKDKKQGMQYSIVSHDVVTAKVRPALLNAGIVYYPVAMSHTQNGNRTEVDLSVRFVNIDKPDDYIDVPGLGYGIDSQDKGPGKAISYAVKYALLKALGLETGDDPDNDQKTTHKPETITESQLMNLESLADEVSADVPRLLSFLRVANLADLESSRYEFAVQALEKKRKAA